MFLRKWCLGRFLKGHKQGPRQRLRRTLQGKEGGRCGLGQSVEGTAVGVRAAEEGCVSAALSLVFMLQAMGSLQRDRRGDWRSGDTAYIFGHPAQREPWAQRPLHPLVPESAMDNPRFMDQK